MATPPAFYWTPDVVAAFRPLFTNEEIYKVVDDLLKPIIPRAPKPSGSRPLPIL